MTNYNTSNETLDFSNQSAICYVDNAKDLTLSKVFLGVMYTVMLSMSVMGNSLVIYVVASNRNMQTVTNLFITNLAISDVVVGLSSLWLTPVYVYLGAWVWGEPSCYLFTLLTGASIFISTLTLTAIAVDRYIVIMHPFRTRMKIQVCLVVIVSIWMASFLLVTPYVFNVTHRYSPTCHVYHCVEQWAVREMRNVYGMIVIILQYGVPFIVITCCYARISFRLRERSQTMLATRSLARQHAEISRKRRMNKMLICMVVIFACCWLPLNVLNIIRDAHTDIHRNYYYPLFFLCAHLVAMSATSWNPVLYTWMNEGFRREFQAVLPCFPGVSRVSRLPSRPSIPLMIRTTPARNKVRHSVISCAGSKEGSPYTNGRANSNQHPDEHPEKVMLTADMTANGAIEPTQL